MQPYEIKAAIMRVGTSQSAIAEYLGVTRSCVVRVISGQARSARIEAELEKITGKPIHPDRPKPGRVKTVWNGEVAA